MLRILKAVLFSFNWYLSTADNDTFSLSFVHCAFLLAKQRRYGKHLHQMSDKSSGGGIIWPRSRTVFCSPVNFAARCCA